MGSIKLQRTMMALLIGGAFAAPAQALVISASNSVEALVDNSSTTRAVNISSTGLVTGVSIFLDFIKCADETRTDQAGAIVIVTPGLTSPLPAACSTAGFGYAEETRFRLTSPMGTTISLIEPGTYDPADDPFGGFRIQVTLLDDVSLPIVGANGVISETANPIQQMAGFGGEVAQGDWTLLIGDAEVFDPLGLYSFTLNVTVADGPSGQAPLPGTLALLGLGLAGLGALNRRR